MHADRPVPPELASPPPGLEEVTLGRQVLFEGSFLRLRRDTVRLPGGGVGERVVVDHPGAVAVLPVTDAGAIVLVWQFRQAAQRPILEIPAGKLGPGERPEDCARRELREETGYDAQRLVRLGRFLPSPGFSGEWLTLFVAQGLVPGPAEPDADEFLSVVECAPDDLARLLADGSIEDLKTACAFWWWRAAVAGPQGGGGP